MKWTESEEYDQGEAIKPEWDLGGITFSNAKEGEISINQPTE